MNQAGKTRRARRLLQSTCLAAGLSLLAMPLHAQSLENATDNPALSGQAAGATGEIGKTKSSASSLARKKVKGKKGAPAAAPDSGEVLNLRAGKLTGSEDDTLLQAEDSVGRDNPRETPIDGVRPKLPVVSTESPGIRLGTFILRPSLTNSIANETTRSTGSSISRTYGQTELKGTLTSDWSRHQLTVTGDGVFQKNISGDGQTDPLASIAADLRLDLPADTVAHLTSGYTLSRESATDPNAVLGAVDQSAVQTLAAGGSIERDFGLLRGLASVDLSRTTYGDVTLTDGSKVSLADRDRNAGTLRLRVGYELSPALIPFLEASAARTIYDESVDSLGYQRDSRSLGGKTGVEIELDEKLKGELGIGYKHVTFADARLAAIDAVVLDAAANWSPRRGTDFTLGLLTTVEPSVVANQSGYVNRALTLAMTQQIRSNLLGRLNGGLTWRSYQPEGTSADELVSTVGTGLTYGINRYLDLTGDISWERTQPDGGEATDVYRAGLGLTLKR